MLKYAGPNSRASLTRRVADARRTQTVPEGLDATLHRRVKKLLQNALYHEKKMLGLLLANRLFS